MSFDQFGKRLVQKAVLEASNGDPLFDFEIEFDVSESETHKSSAKVTDHPVESGAQISDHIINEPDLLDLVLWVSNTPMLPQNQVDTSGISPDRAQEVYEQLLVIKRSGAACTVTTTLREYQDMLITELGVMRSKDTGQALSLTLKLKQLITATNEKVQAPKPKVLRGNLTKDQGKKTTDAASAEVTEKSKTLWLELTQHNDNVKDLTGG